MCTLTVRHLAHPARLYNKLMNLIVRLAEHGLIHGDFNEFNLMVNDEEVVRVAKSVRSV